MAYTDWRLKGPQLSTCNCDWGCPCQFSALPTHGDCKAAVAMRIDEGWLGDVRLDGIHWAGVYSWPKAIHEGNGTALVVIEEGASEEQRGALLTIMSGKETEPGATIFNVMASTFTDVHKPFFKPITFEIDVAARTGHFAVEGIVDARAEPIRNPVTGEPQSAQVRLPNGFEYHEAEYASGTLTAPGPIAQSWSGAHAHLFYMDIGPTGPAH